MTSITYKFNISQNVSLADQRLFIKHMQTFLDSLTSEYLTIERKDVTGSLPHNLQPTYQIYKR